MKLLARNSDAVDKRGKIIPVKDTNYTGNPTVGFVLKAEDGYYAFTARDECERKDSFEEAVNYIGRLWESRRKS